MKKENIKNAPFTAITCIFVLIIGIVGLIIIINQKSNAIQSSPAVCVQIVFDGEYKIADGEWTEYRQGMHIPSNKGDITLRGKFASLNNEIPDLTDFNLVFYESPNRILKTLYSIKKIFGEVKISIARELTKIHEDINTKSISQMIDYLETSVVKGEIVFIVHKKKKTEETPPYIRTGFKELDDLLGGWARGEEFVVFFAYEEHECSLKLQFFLFGQNHLVLLL